MTTPLIRLTDIEFSYPCRDVLKAASLELRAGERLALVGDNGSGKSSLLRLIVGLLRPAAGQVEVFGQPCEAETDFYKVRTQVGYLFQDSDDQLFCPTVIEDVAFGPLNQGLSVLEAEAVAKQTLQRLGMEDYTDRVTHKLSGGEKRMIALATILAMQPKVLLLDEPTNALDEAAEKRLIQVLSELDQAMVIVSHNKGLLEQLATRAVILENGGLKAAVMHKHLHKHEHFHIHPEPEKAEHWDKTHKQDHKINC